MSNLIEQYNRARANRAEARKEKVERAFYQKQNRVNELIKQLQANIQRTSAEARTGGCNWGHVGDLEHVIEQLEVLNESWTI